MTAGRQPSLFERILDPANRANPYPLYAELRETPVTREADGSYVVSTYDEIAALLHDPRISSDPRSHPRVAAATRPLEGGPPMLPLAFIRRDPPDHDRLKRQAMRPFGPPHSPGFIETLRPWLTQTTAGLIDAFAGKDRVDIVDAFAYPLPVMVICKLLGVPPEDAPRFHEWADEIIATVDPTSGPFEQRRERNDRLAAEIGQYLAGLLDARHRRTGGDGGGGEDLLSGMIADAGADGRMSREDLLSTAVLLLVAGHETTVNLIANGVLTLLRHPEVLRRLRREPALVIPLVEELLRYEPPVQFLPDRVALSDIDIAGTTIPRGSQVALVLAAGNRDPEHFPEPDRFIPDRTNNQHFGFGSGIHYCYGAPLARVEAQIALTEFAQRLESPRLVADPPPYRDNPMLRGPLHLLVEVPAHPEPRPGESWAAVEGSV